MLAHPLNMVVQAKDFVKKPQGLFEARLDIHAVDYTNSTCKATGFGSGNTKSRLVGWMSMD